MTMLFYSIVPYISATNVRDSAYLTMFVSLPAMAVTLLFIVIAMRQIGQVSSNRFLILGASILTCMGSLLTAFSDAATSSGMLVLGISAIMTGVGSAILFVGWLELFASRGSRLALIEISLSLCAAFAMGFALSVIPQTFAVIAIAALPLASGYLLTTDANRDAGERAEEVAEQTAGERAGQTPRPRQPQSLSRPTIRLFAKALAGVLLLGILEGFFDVLAGYQTYAVEDIYGLYLLLGGFLAVLAVCLAAVFWRNDGIFHVYRFSLTLLCLGCLLTPFIGDYNTYSNAIIFGGYICFTIALGVVCIKISISFGMGATRCVGIGFFVLYVGEIIGSLIANSLESIMPFPSLESITLVAIFLLFIVHLFLFTEIDLVRIGIGELSLSAAPDEDEKPASGLMGAPESYELVVRRYALSPRESDVLPLLVQGRTISRIQETLYISAGTVSTHVRHIYQKTGVNNRQELLDLVQELAEAPGMVEMSRMTGVPGGPGAQGAPGAPRAQGTPEGDA
jgi:DNA-binding CsgD family transcriptional regulator